MRTFIAFFLTFLAIGPLGAAPVETSVEAPGPAGALAGTMLSADAPNSPIVLIIPGSGPTDRDGNNPLGVKAGTYKLLAEGLATRGITTVRIDKRGLFGSKEAFPDANAVTIPEYAADVHAWTSVIRRQKNVPCLWLLGHSEGALVAMVAAQNAPDICGLVLAAAAGRPIGEVLKDQLEANPANAPVLDQGLKAIDSLEAGHAIDVSGMNPALSRLFRPNVQGFLISEFSYDPAVLLAKYPKPVLILQGERDIQVGVADARRLERADPKAKLVLLPAANHVLKPVASDNRADNLATYANPNLPLAPGVIDAISGFVSPPQP
ncbi:MAG TPA: alpha/beta fold hydrolase [Alphaproteobacteria bacterium]|nr:alpha/beta fold hydrolase [Alphaproteobacteria bacterium]